jgi:hypothetical protein
MLLGDMAKRAEIGPTADIAGGKASLIDDLCSYDPLQTTKSLFNTAG